MKQKSNLKNIVVNAAQLTKKKTWQKKEKLNQKLCFGMQKQKIKVFVDAMQHFKYIL